MAFVYYVVLSPWGELLEACPWLRGTWTYYYFLFPTRGMCWQVGQIGKMDDVFPELGWIMNFSRCHGWNKCVCVCLFVCCDWQYIYTQATKATRLRPRDHYTSSTLIGGKGGSWSKFASHYAWGTNGVWECKMDVKCTWIPTWHQMDHVSCSLRSFFKTTSWR